MLCLPTSVSSQVSANYRPAGELLFKKAGKEYSLITPVGLKRMYHIYVLNGGSSVVNAVIGAQIT
jgi:hypothetical protein